MTKRSTPVPFLALLLACLPLTACKPGEPGVPDMHAYPVSVAYWKRPDRFLVGTFQGGALHSVSVTDAEVTLANPASMPSGHRTALRLAIDEARNRLWVLDFDAAYVYGLSPEGSRIGPLLGRIPVGVDSRIRKGSCFPDMVLDEAGHALVSSNLRSTLAQITLEPGPNPRVSVRHIELKVTDRDRRHFTGITAMALLTEENALVVADARTGTLWRVGRESWQATRMIVPGGVEGACALLPIAKGRGETNTRRLVLSRGFGGGLQVIELPVSGDRGHLGRTLAPADRLVFGLAHRDGIVVFPIGRLMERRDPSGGSASEPMLAAVAVDAAWRCNVPLHARDGRNGLCRVNGFAGGSLR